MWENCICPPYAHESINSEHAYTITSWWGGKTNVKSLCCFPSLGQTVNFEPCPIFYTQSTPKKSKINPKEGIIATSGWWNEFTFELKKHIKVFLWFLYKNINWNVTSTFNYAFNGLWLERKSKNSNLKYYLLRIKLIFDMIFSSILPIATSLDYPCALPSADPLSILLVVVFFESFCHKFGLANDAFFCYFRKQSSEIKNFVCHIEFCSVYRIK